MNTVLVGYVYLKTSKGFLGLGRETTKKWLDIYRVNDFALIKSFFSIFFDNETLLQEQLSLEEKFDSLPAQN